MKPTSKKMFTVLCVIIGLIAIFFIGDFLYRQAYVFVWNNKTDKFMDSLERPYREDTYGGKTPEETWAMFFDAVKKGDVDLAVKYCDYYSQQRCFDDLAIYKDKVKRDEWIKDLRTIRRTPPPETRYDAEGKIISVAVKDDDRVDFIYRYYDEESKRYLGSSVVFQYNHYAKIWKITTI